MGTVKPAGQRIKMKNKEAAISLTEADKDICLQIKEVTGNVLFKNRLESMGVRTSKLITKLTSKKSGGPVIIALAGASSQIALGHGMAKKIMVGSHESI